MHDVIFRHPFLHFLFRIDGTPKNRYNPANEQEHTYLCVTYLKVSMAKERDWHCDDPKHQLIWAAATRDALKVLEGKWKTIIICQLFAAKGPLRFSELEKRVEGVNQKMLIQQLKELQRDRIVTRTVYPQVPPRVEYGLSEIGIALGPSMAELIDWAFMRRDLLQPEVKQDTDLSIS